MMDYMYFIIAIILLTLAHYIKIVRQSQFIEIYEKSPKSVLSKALSITFILNLVVPFKLGNVFRIIYTGKHLQNGKSFSFATIIVDIILDFLTITIIYGILFILKYKIYNSLIFYVFVSGLIVILLFLLFLFKNFIKKAILNISCIFNENIKLKLLKTIWYSITSFKDMLKRVNKPKLFINTLLSVVLYVSSYYFLSLFLNSKNINSSFINIFDMIYGKGNLFNPTIFNFYNNVGINGLLHLMAYIIVPIFIVYISSYFYKNHPKKEKSKKYIQLFPHVQPHDRLVFLEEYFSAEKGKYIESYLNINRDVAIIEDFSAGSNATTMLCSKDGETFYRKYSIGDDAIKLYEQVEWIQKHKKDIQLTDIKDVYYKDNICAYDMPYVSNAVTCFNFIHTMPFQKSWQVLKMVLDDIDKNLHSKNRRKADKELMKLYIKKKVVNNINIIENGSYIKPLLKYEYIYINGQKYHNLGYFKDKYLTEEYLSNVFANDEYSDIHGDFTIENIICLKYKEKNNYYIIDPNTGNLHDSPYLDYAKLLQSIHGGYEFLMNTKNVQFYDNRIDFLFTKSNIYYELFERVFEYLEKKFGKDALKSIFYHEIIHWLRLLPYKIKKNGDRSLLFYAGLIMVLSDVEKRFEL